MYYSVWELSYCQKLELLKQKLDDEMKYDLASLGIGGDVNTTKAE
jgi:hypothetical protein